MNPDFWQGRRVFITGHTGFKGGWLSLWLQSLGSEVHGYSLPSPTTPNLFSTARINEGMASSTIADIRDFERLANTLQTVQPEIIFHLAAQSLVRYSYQNPVETYSVNVMGVVNLLEAVRLTERARAVVNVTSDKCYENREWPWAYRENEALGGHDPYSSSKGCAELVTAAYRGSFLANAGVAVATARAGNVIGGGDWGPDRLLPDILGAIDSGESLLIRSPSAIRPWQHVLEPLSGYLTLAERLHGDGETFAEAWNFGPANDDAQTVAWILEQAALRDPKLAWRISTSEHPHEAMHLKLDSSKARTQLPWRPRWHLQTALSKTLNWHQAWRNGNDMRAETLLQIDEYLNGPPTLNRQMENGSL